MSYQGLYERFCHRYLRGPEAVFAYQALAIVTWTFSTTTSAFYYTDKSNDDRHFWTQSYLHPNPFTMNSVMGTIMWVVIFGLQLAYITQLFSKDSNRRYEATRVCSYFIINNVLHALFVALFAHSYFYWSESAVAINFINLSVLYFRHHSLPWCIHWPIVCCPLAWAFVAIYWNGFVIVPLQSQLTVQIIGAILVFAILGYGLFYLFAYGDHIMAAVLSLLSTSVFIGQVQRLASVTEMVCPLIVAVLLLVAVVLRIRFPQLGRRSKNPDEKLHEKEQDSCGA